MTSHKRGVILFLCRLGNMLPIGSFLNLFRLTYNKYQFLD
jgi:hypothetical protein